MEVNDVILTEMIDYSNIIADNFSVFSCANRDGKMGASLWKRKDGGFWLQSTPPDVNGMTKIKNVTEDQARSFCHAAVEIWADLNEVFEDGWGKRN